jgi:MFS family permease
MDFMIFPLVLGTVIALWDVDRGTAGLVTAFTIVSSAFGGWIGGYLADRFGRVRLIQFTIIWFSFFSFLCAFAQDFTQLAIIRALLGIGFGAEWSAGAILIGETVKAKYRGRAVGSVQSGWAIGWGAAALIQAAVYTYFSDEIAWRVMFAVGALPALLVFYIRRYVEEPAIAVQARQQRAREGQPSIFAIFSAGTLRTTIVASLLCSGATGGYYAVNTWLPTYLNTERHLSIVTSAGYLFVLILGAFTGYIFGAWFADRFGRKQLFVFFAIAATLVVTAYTQLPIRNEVMLVLGFPLGFVSTGHFSGMGPVLSELYPTRLRGSGQGFTYNFGRGIGAFFPALVGYVSHYMSLGNAMTIFAAISYGIMLVMALALPDTTGKELDSAV